MKFHHTFRRIDVNSNLARGRRAFASGKLLLFELDKTRAHAGNRTTLFPTELITMSSPSRISLQKHAKLFP